MTSRRRISALFAIAGLAAFGALGGGSAAARVSVKTSPGLKPGFKTSTPDYVSRCQPGKPLRFTVSASNGDLVGIASQPKRGGDFTTEVTPASGGEVPVGVTSAGRKSTHHVRCLPEDFPRWKLKRHTRPEAQWYVVTPIGSNNAGYMAVFDARGVPMWWMHSSYYGPWDGKLLPNGNLMWTRQYNNFFGVNPKEAWEEHALDGRTLRVLKTVGSPTDMHDVVLLDNGNYLLITYRRRCCADLRAHGAPKDAVVYDGEIQELTPAGKLVWKWNSKDHIKPSENLWWKDINTAQSRKPADERYWDLVHINSVEPDGNGGIIVSSRFLDAVFRIDRATGKVTWKLGGTNRPGKSLKVKNDRLATRPLGGNHDARLYRDGTLTIYDNGTSGGSAPKRRPTEVRYRIDTAKRTATLLERHEEGAIPFSGWGGSTRKLAGGNWVTWWGGTNLMTERTASGKRVLELEFLDDKFSYRAFPIPRGRLTAQRLRRGMNAMLAAGRGELPPPR